MTASFSGIWVGFQAQQLMETNLTYARPLRLKMLDSADDDLRHVKMSVLKTWIGCTPPRIVYDVHP